jgi:hypothetical protein
LENKSSKTKPKLVNLGDVKPEKIRWLWENIPLGGCTLIAGAPSAGKGLFGHYLVGQVTKRGHRVLLSSKEEWTSRMQVPRLDAAGADRSLVVKWHPRLPRDAETLIEAIKENKFKLVLLDPISWHLDCSIYSGQKVQAALEPLLEFAQETRAGKDVAFVFHHHVIKSLPKNAHPSAAFGGSNSGLGAICRQCFIFGRLENGNGDGDDQEHRLSLVKSNISRLPAPSYVFDRDVVDDVPTLEAVGHDEDSDSLDDARLMARGFKDELAPEKIEDASEWLLRFLKDGPQTGATVNGAGKSDGHAKRTLRRAADKLGVIRGRGPGAKWRLPDHLVDAVEDGEDGDA